MEPRQQPPTPEDLTPEERYYREAYILQNGLAACYLQEVRSKGSATNISLWGYAVYFQRLREQTGVSDDPIEQMLVEQLALAYHRVGDLHVQAAKARTPEEAEIYNAAAARLLTEFRRTALAVQEYRGRRSTPQQVTVVKQQNVAAGNQQIAYVGSDTQGQLGGANGKLISNQPALIAHEPPSELLPAPSQSSPREAELVEARPASEQGKKHGQEKVDHTKLPSHMLEVVRLVRENELRLQREASGGGKTELAETRPADAGRSGAAPAGGAEEPPLGALDGSKNARGKGARRKKR